LEELRKIDKIFKEELGFETRRAEELRDVAVDDLHRLRDIKDKYLRRGKYRLKIR